MKSGDIKQFKTLSKIFSLIPLNGKRPIEQNWQQWCEKKRLFNPDDFKGKNAGIACGPGSGIIAVDVDDIAKFNEMLKENNWKLPITRMHITGTGKPHYIYAYSGNGKRYGCRAIKDSSRKAIFDVRGTGGQVVAPGSIHPDTGKPYTVRREQPIAPSPQWLLELALQEGLKIQPQQGKSWDGDLESLPISLRAKKLIKESEPIGERSEAIMSVLSTLVRAKVADKDIFNIFETYPIGEKYREKGRSRERWLQQEISRAKGYIMESKSLDRDHSNLTQDIRNWIEINPGIFTKRDVCEDLNISKDDRDKVSVILARLINQDLIERTTTKTGTFRKIEREAEAIDWRKAHIKTFDIKWPLGIGGLAKVYPKNIIIVAGEQDAGKTGLFLNIVNLNRDKEIYYLSSEMEAGELHDRISNFEGAETGWSKFYPFERSENFQDVIRPDAINIIDYLEISDKFYQIAGQIKDIFNKLKKGIAIIGLQMTPGKELGRGGSFSMEKARLYITISKNPPDGAILKIVKAKKRARPDVNPNYQECHFKIINGSKLIKTKDWHYKAP